MKSGKYQIQVGRIEACAVKRVLVSQGSASILSFQVNDTAPANVYGYATVWAPGLRFGNTLGQLLTPESDLANILNSIFPGKAVQP